VQMTKNVDVGRNLSDGCHRSPLKKARVEISAPGVFQGDLIFLILNFVIRIPEEDIPIQNADILMPGLVCNRPVERQ
jgi:hypothetical protein